MAQPAYVIKKLECDAFDSRVVQRQIASGRTTREAYKSHLDGLADSADEGETITVTLEEEEDEGAEDDAEAADGESVTG